MLQIDCVVMVYSMSSQLKTVKGPLQQIILCGLHADIFTYI